ncbi:unnamed protein product [Darwinula stevensoni]|uniref:Arsenite methyltransferase n=1 Tax=Darwinula stevensoni TaxID=69355 RepID=A0A7R9ABP6_9CRUS|nr:unnamed protein product [Darwinula stevensoni]CAG0899573.1 unnamed protein product [Darwinula stevensoni]
MRGIPDSVVPPLALALIEIPCPRGRSPCPQGRYGRLWAKRGRRLRGAAEPDRYSAERGTGNARHSGIGRVHCVFHFARFITAIASVILPSDILRGAMSCCKKEKHAEVQEYYGKEVKSQKDLKSVACIVQGSTKIPQHVKQCLANVHDEIMATNYGCGYPFPDGLTGCKVLDLGSGTGRDVFVLSQLVGGDGAVVGVDMTPEQIAKAEEYADHHMKKFGFEKSNVSFKLGYMEDLKGLKLQEDYFDVIVSNCVVNLCPDKRAALAQAFDHLKVGGELYFSDIYASCPVPKVLQENKDLWGECYSGALWWEDLHSICADVGFHSPIIKESKPVPVTTEELQRMHVDELPKDLTFASVTYRLFKPSPSGDDASPKAATYDGGLQGCSDSFEFAHDLVFKVGSFRIRVFLVVK